MLQYILFVSIFLANTISIWYNKGGSKILTLKNDYLFKALFTKSGNEILLRDFLEGVLEEKIGVITIQKDASLEKSTLDEKLGILDLCIKQENKRILNIEMQVVNEYNVEDRALYYASRLIGSQLKKGESYQNLKPVIVIFILDFEFISFQEYITNVVMVAEKHREYTMIPKLKFLFIELPKFRKLQNKNMNHKLAQWLSFIDGENKEMIQMAIQKNKVIEKANTEWEYLTGNAEKRRLAELREKYLKDEANIRSGAKAEGIQIGKEMGEKIGEKRARENIIKELLQYDIDIEKIAKVMRISEKEIEKRKRKK